MKRYRGSAKAMVVLILAGLGFLATWLDHVRLSAPRDNQPARALVTGLGITDLALFNEARYTRHPSQADRHAAFQDQPMALDHFPSGSVLPPPRGIGHAFPREAGEDR